MSLPSLLVGSCFVLGVWSEPPLAAHPLSTSGSFSRRTLCPSLICLPIPVHTAEIQAIFSACRPDNGDPRSLLYWFRVQLIRWQGHLPVGPNLEGCAGSLSGSFARPPFSWSEWLEGTFPAGSGGGVAPPPSRADICLETYPCPYDSPFLGSINPLHLPTPGQ